jgi:hypothetical protein
MKRSHESKYLDIAMIALRNIAAMSTQPLARRNAKSAIRLIACWLEMENNREDAKLKHKRHKTGSRANAASS